MGENRFLEETPAACACIVLPPSFTTSPFALEPDSGGMGHGTVWFNLCVVLIEGLGEPYDHVC